MVVHLIALPNTVPSSQTLMSVLRIMEDATRTVPTLSGATSAVVRMAIYSTKMREAVMVSSLSGKSRTPSYIDSTKKPLAICKLSFFSLHRH